MWQPLFELELEIQFAYKSFVWTNNAKNKAAVICVIIGVAHKDEERVKYIYSDQDKVIVDKINPTLSDEYTCLVESQSKSISNLKPMLKGSLPADDNNLTMYEEEKEEFLNKYPKASYLIKKFVGSQEFIQGLSIVFG